MGLSVAAFVALASTTDQLRPESVERATAMSLLSFCSQAAKTVRPSTGSTTICVSTCSVTEGAIGRGGSQVAPRSRLTCRMAVGLAQAAHPGTPPYCG